MRKKWRILVGILVVAVVAACVILLGGGTSDFHAKYDGRDLTTEVSGIGRDDTYEVYLRTHEGVAAGTEVVAVDVAAFEGYG